MEETQTNYLMLYHLTKKKKKALNRLVPLRGRQPVATH